MASIAVGADDAGAPLKERLAAYLRDHGYEIKDFGNGDGQDYPDVAAEVAEAVARGDHDRALLVCRTGPGMAIAAKKAPGAPPPPPPAPSAADRPRNHNSPQALPGGPRVIAPEAAEKVLDH